MRFKTVKKSSEITLEGVKVELDFVDGALKAAHFTDPKGNTLRITERGYNLYAEIPAPPETEKKYKLHGHVLDVPVEKIFDDEFEANQEKRRLEDEAARSELKVEKVEVLAAA